MKRWWSSAGLRPLWLIVVLVIVWDLAVRLFKIPPYLVPNPLSVAKQLVAEWPMLWRERCPRSMPRSAASRCRRSSAC